MKGRVRVKQNCISFLFQIMWLSFWGKTRLLGMAEEKVRAETQQDKAAEDWSREERREANRGK